MLTMQRKGVLKNNSIRYAEYYDMVKVLDKLYRDSVENKVFTDLVSIISTRQNIEMAYRNLKKNTGSSTPGVDGVTFKDLGDIPGELFVKKVQDKIRNYQPKAVRRVYIPKPNGKMRPLGIPTVIDRVVQQSVLQVMEPICEAKFYKHSYGFRPNRSTKEAVAFCYKLAQHDGFHYVVDVDIKGFFDNVDHGKLLKQIWSLGIRDKQLICLISHMLKAPIEENGERSIPERGTPQGGVLSPLLANIVLNELDWWIASQWEEMIVHDPHPSDVSRNRNGSPNKGGLYNRLRKTNLKEVRIVRYADDFKLFCRSYDEAVRMKKAVEMWLWDRLRLETSPEKSKITNLTTGYSEFLGIRFRLFRKGKKWVIKSHMTDKAIAMEQDKLKKSLVKACKAHATEKAQHDDIIAYNQAVVGIHGYYNMATMVNEDVHRLFPALDRTMKIRCARSNSLSKKRPDKLKGGMDEYFFQRYGKSKQVRYINGMIVVPVAYCRMVNPMCHSPTVNKYTPEGRTMIHSMLQKGAYAEVLFELAHQASSEGIEFCDNRLSRFVAAKGRCEITKKPLLIEDVACIRIIPRSRGGDDSYDNLRIVCREVAEIAMAVNVSAVIEKVRLISKEYKVNLKKLNQWRCKAGLDKILMK